LAVVLFLGLIATLVYAMWRGICALRHRPVGGGHPSWRAIGIAFALGFVAFVVVAPADEDQSAQDRAASSKAAIAPTATPTPTPTRSPAPTPTATRAKRSNGTALDALETLEVKGRAPMTGYDREEFGGDWASVNGCDTRERVLKRDLRAETYEPGSTCEMRTGRLADPYTATLIAYERGGASEVDIDHVVALGDAWQKGAQQWTPARRVRFANDPLNLLAVDASANRQKGDGDAATWLPANKSFRCTYVARQIAVKQRYDAWVTPAERDAMRRVLARCPDTKVPRTGRSPVPVIARSTNARSAPTPTPEPAEPPSSDGRTFVNCDAVRAAGRAPLLRGDPAYEANPQLDRDKDGVACEP
jgi:uncharacterized protein DUF1524/excalibur calcium-binding domain-containing protein